MNKPKAWLNPVNMPLAMKAHKEPEHGAQNSIRDTCRHCGYNVCKPGCARPFRWDQSRQTLSALTPGTISPGALIRERERMQVIAKGQFYK